MDGIACYDFPNPINRYFEIISNCIAFSAIVSVIFLTFFPIFVSVVIGLTGIFLTGINSFQIQGSFRRQVFLTNTLQANYQTLSEDSFLEKPSKNNSLHLFNSPLKGAKQPPFAMLNSGRLNGPVRQFSNIIVKKQVIMNRAYVPPIRFSEVTNRRPLYHRTTRVFFQKPLTLAKLRDGPSVPNRSLTPLSLLFNRRPQLPLYFTPRFQNRLTLTVLEKKNLRSAIASFKQGEPPETYSQELLPMDKVDLSKLLPLNFVDNLSKNRNDRFILKGPLFRIANCLEKINYERESNNMLLVQIQKYGVPGRHCTRRKMLKRGYIRVQNQLRIVKLLALRLDPTLKKLFLLSEQKTFKLELKESSLISAETRETQNLVEQKTLMVTKYSSKMNSIKSPLDEVKIQPKTSASPSNSSSTRATPSNSTSTNASNSTSTNASTSNKSKVPNNTKLRGYLEQRLLKDLLAELQDTKIPMSSKELTLLESYIVNFSPSTTTTDNKPKIPNYGQNSLRAYLDKRLLKDLIAKAIKINLIEPNESFGERGEIIVQIDKPNIGTLNRQDTLNSLDSLYSLESLEAQESQESLNSRFQKTPSDQNLRKDFENQDRRQLEFELRDEAVTVSEAEKEITADSQAQM